MKSFFSFLFIVVSLSVVAQKPSEFIAAGNALAAENKWEEATAYYEEAYKRDSSAFDHIIKLAEGYRHIKEYPSALALYQEAYGRDEGKLFPEGMFWIASMEKLMGDYEAAQRDFRKYTKKHAKDKKSVMYKRAMMEIEACVWAMGYKLPKDAPQLTRQQIYPDRHSSENPTWVELDKLFLSNHSSASDQWKLEWGTWKDSVVIEVFGERDDSVTIDYANVWRDRFGYYYFSRCGAYCEIYKTNDTLLDVYNAKPLNAINAQGANTTMPTTAVIDGEDYLFFVSDRKGGEGKMDIWWAKASNGVFINPENAGNLINTEDYELTPFYHEGQLYFSSDWHRGFGGLDVFSLKGKPGSWDIPVNMGQPWNSSLNDLYYRSFGDTLFVLASNRYDEKGEGACCNDVFTYIKKSEKVEEKTNTPESLSDLMSVLPVTLYFHNDEPNPRTLDTLTQWTYSETYEAYLKLIPVYRDEKIKGLAQNDHEDALYEVDDFFELKVNKGMADLQLFADLLILELEAGRSVEVDVRGFASPRAKSDYNKNLSLRRISSLKNELEKMRDSLFYPYLNGTSANGARLIIKPIPFGEDQSAKEVSDDLKDEKQSIYSRGARLERRIEIEKVRVIQDTASRAVLNLKEDFHDFGKVGKHGVVHHEFVVENSGNEVMLIDSVVASCGCTDPVMSSMIIAAHQSATLDVGFNPFGGHGKEVKYVVIYARGEKPRVITIEAEVE